MSIAIGEESDIHGAPAFLRITNSDPTRVQESSEKKESRYNIWICLFRHVSFHDLSNEL